MSRAARACKAARQRSYRPGIRPVRQMEESFPRCHRSFTHGIFGPLPDEAMLAPAIPLYPFAGPSRKAMPNAPSSRSLAALKEILAGVERTIAIFERSGRSLVDPDDAVGTKLRRLRRLLQEQIEVHPENRRPH